MSGHLYRIYTPAIETSNLVNAAKDSECTRLMMVRCYVDCLMAGEGVDWKAVNLAILTRWPKWLESCKRLAWAEYSRRLQSMKGGAS